MPKIGFGNASNGPWTTIRIKRLTALALIILAVGLALDQSFGSFAALTDDQDQEATSRKITRDDCGYLQNPDSFRQSLAQHREKVSDVTTTFVATMTETEATLVPPQSIPRKNFIDNIIFDRMQRDS